VKHVAQIAAAGGFFDNGIGRKLAGQERHARRRAK
jgi:hypothetical protein